MRLAQSKLANPPQNEQGFCYGILDVIPTHEAPAEQTKLGDGPIELSRQKTVLIDWSLAGSLLAALISYGYLGSFSRYMADDYAALRPVQKHGFLSAQFNWYQGWTGRFSFTFLYSLLALLGPATTRFMPALLLALWFAATVWAIYQIYSLSGEISWPRIVVFAAFIIFATLETAPNVAQSLYWQTAAVTHVAPFIPLSLYLGLVSRDVRKSRKQSFRKFNIAGAGVLTLLAGGLGDAYVVFQSFGLILSIIVLQIFAGNELKSRLRAYLVAGLIGSLFALTIVVASPGNSVRRAFFPKQFGGLNLLGITIAYTIGFVGKLVFSHPVIFLASLTLPLLIALRGFSLGNNSQLDQKSCVRLLWMTPAAVFLLIMCCTGASFYAISLMLPERARILLSLILVCGTLVWSHAAGEYLAQRFRDVVVTTRQKLWLASTVGMLLLIVVPLVSSYQLLAVRERARSFAADWDRQDSKLKVAKETGTTDVTVEQIWDFQSRIGKGPSDLHLRTDPDFWINRTTASYYGLRSIRASEDVWISH